MIAAKPKWRRILDPKNKKKRPMCDWTLLVQADKLHDRVEEKDLEAHLEEMLGGTTAIPANPAVYINMFTNLPWRQNEVTKIRV